MVRHRTELLHFVELLRLNDGQRVFLPVHDFRLQRSVELVDGDRGGRCAKGAEQRDPQWTRRHPNFEILEIVRRIDRFRAGRHVPKAAVEAFWKTVDPNLLEPGSYFCPKVSVNGLPDLS